jgi:heat shock protein HtpX
MYSQIDKNKNISCVLLVAFVIIVVGLTFLISYGFTGDQFSGIALGFLAFFISLFSSLITYFFGDSIVLSMTGAVDVSENPQYKELNDRIETLAIKAGIPKPKVHVMPDMALNAFATGRNPEHGHIALTQGIIQAMTPQELEGVIAHEMSHIRNYDIRLMLIVSVLAGVLTYLADFALRGMFFGSRDNDRGGGNPIMFIIAIVLAILAPIISALIQLAISRRREFLADISAVEITRYPNGMISALQKLAADDRPVERATEGNAHMFIDFPLKDAKGFIQKLFSTHPPIEDRIKALQNM